VSIVEEIMYTFFGGREASIGLYYKLLSVRTSNFKPQYLILNACFKVGS